MKYRNQQRWPKNYDSTGEAWRRQAWIEIVARLLDKCVSAEAGPPELRALFVILLEGLGDEWHTIERELGREDITIEEDDEDDWAARWQQLFASVPVLQGNGHKRMPLAPARRFEALKRDNYRCQYCGRTIPEVILEVDHIIPVAQGGTDALENLRTSCRDCNRGKGAS